MESNTGTNPDTNTGENTAQSPQQCCVIDVGDKQRKYNANTDTSNTATNTSTNADENTVDLTIMMSLLGW